MKLVIYAGGEYLTGDEIAEALIDLSEALADDGSAETIDLPFIDRDGTRQTASFLVGPASQIVAKTISEESEELRDPDAVERIQARIRGLHATAAAAGPDDDDDAGAHDWTDSL